MTERLLTIISEETGRTVTLQTSLDDLGMDSLDFVSLMQEIGKVYQEIPESEWSNLNTVQDIVLALQKPQG